MPNPLQSVIAAAKDGNRSAAFVLGRMYDAGWVVKANPSKAFAWYRVAADRGYREAFYLVAWCYHIGGGVRQDEKRGYEWFCRAAEAGDLIGEYMAALCKYDGTGTRKNKAEGIRLLKRAAPRVSGRDGLSRSALCGVGRPSGGAVLVSACNQGRR
jgi:TPR repeat protein